MRIKLTRALLAGAVALGLTAGAFAVPAQAYTTSGTCWGWTVTAGVVRGGTLKGWIYLKNTFASPVWVIINDNGSEYQLITEPGKIYYFDNPNIRFRC